MRLPTTIFHPMPVTVEHRPIANDARSLNDDDLNAVIGGNSDETQRGQRYACRELVIPERSLG
jgi:hypothetical protein